MWFLLLACSSPKEQDTSASTVKCVNEDILGTTIEPFIDGPTTQIHSDLAFDGEHIWTVFNLPNDENTFDVFLASMDCSGNVVTEPTQILNIAGLNQTTPRIAYSNNHILVASQGDNGNSSNNLSIHLYLQEVDGTLIHEVEWVPEIDGQPTGNRWLPTVSGSDNGFWLAAAVANENHFRTAVQRIDIDGTFSGNTHWSGPNSYAVFPSIDGDDEHYVVGWQTSDDSVQWATGTPTESNNDVVTYDNSANVDVLWNDGAPLIFAHRVSPMAALVNDTQLSSLGGTFYTNATQGSTTIFTRYFDNQTGYQNDVYGAFLQNDAILETDILLQSSPSAAPYRPAVTHLGHDQYFILWSQGNHPDFTLAGQFVEAPQP